MKTYISLTGNVITSVVECSDDMPAPDGAILLDTDIPMNVLSNSTYNNGVITPMALITSTLPTPKPAGA